MISDLHGRVALVTGCTGGIGAATCRILAEAGAKVVGTDIHASVPDAPYAYHQHDVTNEGDWNRVIAAVETQFGDLDILVNNAGIVIVKSVEQMSLEDFRRTMAVNVDGVFLGMKAAIGLMRRTGEKRPQGASLINVSSNAGLIGAPLHVAYCGSKGAVRLMTKAAALEFSGMKYKVRVNSIHPGGVKTAMLDQIMNAFLEAGFAKSLDEIHAGLDASHPIGRMSDPAEIARAIRFLASDESSYMHGSELVVDGAYTAR